MSALLVVAVVTLSVFVHSLWTMHNSDSSIIRGDLRAAIDNMYLPTVIDPHTKQQYIYEASLTFPTPAVSRATSFRYAFQPAEKEFKASIGLTTTSLLAISYNHLGTGTPNDVFQNVPDFQNCSKELIIQFASGVGDERFSLTTTKKLADGRTLYLYQNSSCAAFYKANSVDIASDIKTAEGVQSY